MAAWMNGDGLAVKFGTEEHTSLFKAGQYSTMGPEQIIEVTINNAVLLTETEQIVNDTVWIPDNCQIAWVEVVTQVACTTGTAIDVGTIALDRSTEGDYDGLLAAFPTAEMAQVGETRRFYETHTIPASMTGTGALVGQMITAPCYITASRTDSTAFGAGAITIRIAYLPNAN